MNEFDNKQIVNDFKGLSTPLVADSLVRLGLPPRCAPSGIRPLIQGTHIVGRALPVRHYGSVDVFFEAMSAAQPGDILVIDNQGRWDEGCIGDLTALEARAYDMAGMLVWGCHRDTHELIEIGFPVFSYGCIPFGPLRVDQRETEPFAPIRFGEVTVEYGDIVFADDDGVVFTPQTALDDLLSTAKAIHDNERRQAEAIARGETLHRQLEFEAYLVRRKGDPDYSFRQHLRQIGGAIEE